MSKQNPKLKIALWNVERPKKGQRRIPLILEKIRSLDADILVLTETNEIVNPGNHHRELSSQKLIGNIDAIDYQDGENRTTIWTKLEILARIETSDEFTNVCARMATPFGEMILYAGITGIFGGTGQRFKTDLAQQISDWEKFDPSANICIAGDMNTMLSGYAYPSRKARSDFFGICQKLNLDIPTQDIQNNVDHILISQKITSKNSLQIQTWNEDFKLSDHIGLLLTIS